MIAARSAPGRLRARTIAMLAVTLTTGVPLVCAPAAAAATLKVRTTRDGLAAHGRCTLREAIEAVDSPGTRTACGRADRGPNTIRLGRGRYVLSIRPRSLDDNSTGDLNVDGGAARLSIAGVGVGATVLDAAGLGDRVLSVAAGARLTVSRLSITGGRAPAGAAGASVVAGCLAGGAGGAGAGAGSSGGGVFNAGTLVLDGVAVRGNRAGAGGAGASASGAGCTGADGGQGGGGGGIYNRGSLTVARSTVSGNSAGAGGAGGAGGSGAPGGVDPVGAQGSGGAGGPGGIGGGIDNEGTLTVTASTIATDHAGAGGGAGAGGQPGSGGAGAAGGGIFSGGRRLTVTNSTLAGNLAGAGGAGALESPGGSGGGGGGAGGSGGAIANAAGSGRVTNATVAGNGVGVPGAPASAPAGGVAGVGSGGGSSDVAGVGGGLFLAAARHADDLQLQNSIVASNLGANCAAAARAAISDAGHNLSFGDGTCPGGHGDPRLGALKDNGGPTATMAIGAGGAAVDRVPARRGGCPATDQRGVRRAQGARCDIGAYEYAIPRITITTPFQGASYERGSTIHARFGCDEGGVASTIATCDGTVARGRAIDTGRLGAMTFVVTAVDKNGARARVAIHYHLWVYVDPLREVSGLTPRRIDLGVDYAGSGPLLALGRARVETASDTDSGPSSCWAISCWPGGGIVVLRLLDGPFAGKYTYVAEHISTSVRPGQIVNAGQQIATLHAGYPWSEWGWAAGPGPEALAMADGHACHICSDIGDWSTIEGRNMNALLVRLGAPSGLLGPVPAQKMPAGWPVWPR